MTTLSQPLGSVTLAASDGTSVSIKKSPRDHGVLALQVTSNGLELSKDDLGGLALLALRQLLTHTSDHLHASGEALGDLGSDELLFVGEAKEKKARQPAWFIQR
jgi:hypothetical protein